MCDHEPRFVEMTALSADSVLSLIPQQDPFRFVSSLTYVNETGSSGTCTFVESNPIFGGHFPRNPIVPGVVLLEGMGQIGIVALGIYLAHLGSDQIANGTMMATDIDASIFSVVYPGDEIICVAKMEVWRRGRLRASVSASTPNGDRVASGLFSGMLALGPSPQPALASIQYG